MVAKAGARCGGTIDRQRGHSSYCSDSCKAEQMAAVMPVPKAGDPWAFATDPRLFTGMHRVSIRNEASTHLGLYISDFATPSMGTAHPSHC